ncbi:hypothetical protein V5F45_16480 [Xanthobacter sp. V1C-2]
MRIAWFDAGGMTDNTIHVLDAAASNALDVVVIILNTRFVPRAGGIRQADATDQALPGKALHDQVDGLKRDGRQRWTHGLKDGFGIGMRMMVQEIQDRDALHGGAQPLGSQGLNPVRGAVDGRWKHAGSMDLIVMGSI